LRRVRPVKLLEHCKVVAFGARVGRIVAPVPVSDDTGMIADAPDLITERFSCDIVVVVLPLVPAFPEIAAAPAGNYQDAFTVALFQEPAALGLSFEPDGVEVHVFDIADFLNLALRRRTKKHVGCPAAATDQDRLSVDLEYAIALFV